MVGAVKVFAGNIEGLVSEALCTEVKLDGAELALAVTVASVTVTREAHAHGSVTGERDETESVSDELVVEDRGVDLDFNEVDGDGRDLRDHHAPKRVGHTRVRLSKLELDHVVLHFPDLHLRESLVRHSSVHDVSVSEVSLSLSNYKVIKPKIWGFCLSASSFQYSLSRSL